MHVKAPQDASHIVTCRTLSANPTKSILEAVGGGGLGMERVKKAGQGGRRWRGE